MSQGDIKQGEKALTLRGRSFIPTAFNNNKRNRPAILEHVLQWIKIALLSLFSPVAVSNSCLYLETLDKEKLWMRRLVSLEMKDTGLYTTQDKQKKFIIINLVNLYLNGWFTPNVNSTPNLVVQLAPNSQYRRKYRRERTNRKVRSIVAYTGDR